MTKKALVVVLGELARSPRMQYHCMSLAKSNYDVTVIANGGDKACENLEWNENIHQQLMPDSINFKKFLPSVVAYIVKTIWLSLLLIIQLFKATVPHVIIVQNPPSIPTLPIIYLYARITGSRLIIDWHNYGFTIMSISLKPDNLLVRVSKFIEIYFGRLADAGFCVSKAMQRDLIENFSISYPIHVLYDKPPRHFKPMSVEEKHAFFMEIQDQIPAFKNVRCSGGTSDHDGFERTRFTTTNHEKNVVASEFRPAIVLSSTSWTEDEDFDLLLGALQHYNQRLVTMHENFSREEGYCNDEKIGLLPNLVCVITGKGPLKSFYENKIKQCNFKYVEIVLPWLSAGDYAKMVGSCDIGISLHSSSSGVDLPMKVVDMFGCCIPVLAYRYKAIGELVVEDVNGLTFKDSHELFRHLVELLPSFHLSEWPKYRKLERLERYRKNISAHFLKSRWETNWDKVAKPLIDKLSE